MRSSNRFEIAPMGQDSASVIGCCRDLLVLVGHSPPTEQDALYFRQQIEKLLELFPEGIGILGVLRESSVPNRPAREALVDLFSAHGARLQAAFVPLGSGFAAATQRSILAAALIATRRSKSIRVLSSITEAASVLQPVVAGLKDLSPVEIERAVQAFVQQQGSR